MADLLYPVPEAWAARARFDAARLAAERARARAEPEAYWLDAARRLEWIAPPTRADESSFDEDGFAIRWFADGRLNLSVQCLDRHLATLGDTPAILFEPDDPAEGARSLTYAELHREVCRAANALKALGVTRGERVTIYMPMVPEAAIAMLACARIGAIHSVVFGGFSPEALAGRIADCQSRFVITADEGRRGGRAVPLKANVDAALAICPQRVDAVLVYARTGGAAPRVAARDHDWGEALAAASAECAPEPMGAEDPLFILYTSGSTGKPKGVLHSTGGYALWASMTHEAVFDARAGQVFWCTADVGWITGHSYVVYGPLMNGVTSVMFEGVPTWPDASRLWQVVDKFAVETFYTAPTAIRALMREGDEFVTASDRSSLRLLGTVGEPINPEAWSWYHRVVGAGRCPIVDTWWQTETGGILLSPLPGATPLKPGSATRPLPGIEPMLLDAQGQPIEGEGAGSLVLAKSWPGQMRGVWGDPQRFFDTYFRAFPGFYFTGDGARRDGDGDYWITGRIDDVINVSGHRLGTAEIESALVGHPAVAEAAVVGMGHAIKGQGIHAFVTLKAGIEPSAALEDALGQEVRRVIGAIARPDVIQFAPGLPKTRSGKIMRRILRKIAEGEGEALGDISTLADPGVVAQLLAGRGGA